MKDDFEIIKHSFAAEDPIHIYPIADVHLGSPEHNDKEWQGFLSTILNDPVGYVVLVGDLCDTALKNSKSDSYTATMTVFDQIKTAAEQLKPLADAGRILGMVGGNHEKRVAKETGIDVSWIIADKLGIADLYRPAMAFLQIKLNQGTKSHAKKRCYYIGMTHGNGGGSGYSFLNKNQQFAQVCECCDLIITGHTHKEAHIIPSRLRINRNKGCIEPVPVHCVTASSWLDYGGYALEKMLLPSATCRPQIITLYGDHKDITVTM